MAHTIVSFHNFTLVFLFGIMFFVMFDFFQQPTIEGFSYATCRNKGFTPGFCVATPVAGSANGTCSCADGSLGITIQGTGARCICGKAISEPWNQSKKPLLYDGVASMRTTSRTHRTSSNSEEGPHTNRKIPKTLNPGSWWLQVKWI